MSAHLKARFPLIYDLCTARRRTSLLALALLYVVTSYGGYLVMLVTSDGMRTTDGVMVGGDFLVFRAGAMARDAAARVSYYDIGPFMQVLRGMYPDLGPGSFAWPYPPQMFLLVKPLAGIPFIPGFLLWEGIFLLVFVATLRSIWPNRYGIVFAVASPAVFSAIITGQTGLLTGSMLALSAANAERRPWLTGAAAALLTIKPQFGILLPIALVAGRHWRAVAAAAVLCSAVAATSVLVFGFDVWRAFARELVAHGQLLATEGAFPVGKLNTPFGGAAVLGISHATAMTLQLVATAVLAAFVYLCWRRVAGLELRVATLAAATALATPYGFYYEMPILVVAMLLVGKHASESGWLPGEQLSLMLLWFASFLPPGSSAAPAVPVSFLVSLGAFGIVLRRVLPALLVSRNAGRALRPAPSLSTSS